MFADFTDTKKKILDYIDMNVFTDLPYTDENMRMIEHHINRTYSDIIPSGYEIMIDDRKSDTMNTYLDIVPEGQKEFIRENEIELDIDERAIEGWDEF